MSDFPSLRWPELRKILEAEPLAYRPALSHAGSHRKYLSKNGYPPLRLAFHDRQEISPGLVRKILVTDVGLSPAEALRLL